ncbi:MAG: virulence protein RhuM/Fic/DOC family protein [Proteobacteria bacterium]|nr:virulence protein RhuM/Fic/DOC family protein [Pseudomonadota bacterium]
MTQRKDEITLYQTPDGAITLDVRLEGETVWLTQKQMAMLFDTERSVITKHLRNIFATRKLQEESNVQKMHIAHSDKPVKFYNLDIIISIGYRVNSKRGTQFRIWASNVLRDHILRGYSINDARLKELNQAIRLIAEVADRKVLTGDEATALLRVVADYSYALDLLDDYDHERVRTGDTTVRPVSAVAYEEAIRLIERLRRQFIAGDVFGLEKDDSLKGSLANIMQTFDGKELYPSLEEKAAHLLYFLVKNHSFVDGNKRIAAALFLWFLEKNDALYGTDGSKRIADNALVAMTLLIAESRPEEKDVLTRVVVNLINRRNQ